MSDSHQPAAANLIPATPPTELELQLDDCWSRIGVSGDGSCPELEKYFHCRNCPVYAAAGARLLERPFSNNYRLEWALHFARPKSVLAPGAISAVLFRVGPEWLALPTTSFQEVAEMRKVHSIPHRRKGTVLGIVNVRGELVVCLSLARVLGLQHAAKAEGDRTVYERLLVASWESHRVVFPVDEVHGVHRFDPDQLREPPATLSKSGTSYTKGVLSWRGRLAICLDAELLFPALSESIA